MANRPWGKRGLKRLLALGMCIGMGMLPWASMGAEVGMEGEDLAVVGEPIIATPTPKPWEVVKATLTPSPSSTPGHTASPVPSGTVAPSKTATPPPTEEELSADDSALTESQVGSLLQNAELGADEKAEDYLALPEGISKKQDGTFSILLIGMDSHRGEKRGRSDAMILAHANLKTGNFKLVSFLRDMYVKIPDRGMNRLNAAYYYGGAPLLKRTLESNFGVYIDCTVAVDFSAMAGVIDEIGGVTVAVSEKERVQMNKLLAEYAGKKGYQQLMDAGEQNLSGMQALFYSRIRKIDSDFQRTSRQHRVLEAVFAKLSQQDLPTLLNVATSCFDKVETDMTLQDIRALLPLMLKAGDATFSAMHVPLDNAYQDDVVGGMMVLMPNLKKNTQAVATFLEE